MEILRYDEHKLVKDLETLRPRDRIAFAAACTERIMPMYRRYWQLTNQGSPEILEDILARVWNDLEGNRVNNNELNVNLDNCMKLIPAEETKPWLPELPAAEDAAVALAYTLRCFQSGNPQESAWAAARAYEALDQYVIHLPGVELNAPVAEEYVLSHPFIQAELSRQRRDLNDLVNDKVSIAELKQRSIHESRDFMPLQ